MSRANDDNLLAVVLDSLDRNNRILVNLLRALPPDVMAARVMPTSQSVTEMFVHMLYVRLIFITEDAPDHVSPQPPREWLRETDPKRIADGLDSSAVIVRDVVEDYVSFGKAMQQHYDHPILFLQHMIWHEGYHHGQIKLALKVAGHPLDDKQVGPGTWGLWMRKSNSPVSQL
jgi:uncharacterized damage-inducible protein DinB